MNRLFRYIRIRIASHGPAERVQLLIAFGLQVAIAVVAAGAFVESQWLVAFTAVLVLTLTFTPALIEQRFGLHIPVEFTLLTCLILYASFGLGEIGQFYARFWWWDLLLHSLSAAVIGLIGFLTVYVMYMTRRIEMSAGFLGVVSFGFAVTLGTIWELFEFSMDWLFGFNMQKSGLVDTMTDLMMDAAGGVLAGWMGYHYVKGRESLIVDRMVRWFVRHNPHLFRRQHR